MKTYEQHRQRHKELHHALDELVADWLVETEGLPSECSVMELLAWSYEQTVVPSDKRERFEKDLEVKK